ncbi:hypothetical protein Q8F55_008254 [Vanrija albida]|uniref:MARVEL domain-containing protein n=1 Tax=Vanrija albida TaxID=181172 RepID=A0ABR3PWR4_9TREE
MSDFPASGKLNRANVLPSAQLATKNRAFSRLVAIVSGIAGLGCLAFAGIQVWWVTIYARGIYTNFVADFPVHHSSGATRVALPVKVQALQGFAGSMAGALVVLAALCLIAFIFSVKNTIAVHRPLAFRILWILTPIFGITVLILNFNSRFVYKTSLRHIPSIDYYNAHDVQTMDQNDVYEAGFRVWRRDTVGSCIGSGVIGILSLFLAYYFFTLDRNSRRGTTLSQLNYADQTYHLEQYGDRSLEEPHDPYLDTSLNYGYADRSATHSPAPHGRDTSPAPYGRDASPAPHDRDARDVSPTPEGIAPSERYDDDPRQLGK